eukprot:Amastigsp_a509224_10.p5 type:complete len:101 gc:universal Amastigsp_a509224_10:1035-1337(+)
MGSGSRSGATSRTRSICSCFGSRKRARATRCTKNGSHRPSIRVWTAATIGRMWTPWSSLRSRGRPCFSFSAPPSGARRTLRTSSSPRGRCRRTRRSCACR